MAATIQIVLFLSILIFVYDEMLNAIYVILLAVFNDATVVLTGYDRAVPSSRPQRPTISFYILLSGSIGALNTALSFAFFLWYGPSFLEDQFQHVKLYRQSAIYAQIGISMCSLILLARSDGFFFQSRPHNSLLLSTLAGMVIITCLCGFGLLIHQVAWRDLGLIWAFVAVSMLIIDTLKVVVLLLSGEERTYEALHLKKPAMAMEELYGEDEGVLVRGDSKGDDPHYGDNRKEDEGSVGSSEGITSHHPSIIRASDSFRDVEKAERSGPVYATTPGHIMASHIKPYPVLHTHSNQG